MASDNAWHLDKKVPIALILMILAQTGSAFWFFANLDGRVTNAQAENIRQDQRLTVVEDRTTQQAVSNATLAEQMSGVRQSLTELKDAQRETNSLLRDLTKGGSR